MQYELRDRRDSFPDDMGKSKPLRLFGHIALALVVAAALLLASGLRVAGLTLVIAAASLFLVLRLQTHTVSQRYLFRPTAIDYGVLIILSADLLAMGFTLYEPNTLRILLEHCALASIFFMFRCLLRDDRTVFTICRVVTAAASVVSVYTLFRFTHTAERFSSLGLGYSPAFRNMFPVPLEMASTYWVTIFLVFLPFAYTLLLSSTTRLSSLIYIGAVSLLLLVILVSFTRGLYVALAVYLVGLSIALRVSKIASRRLLAATILFPAMLSLSLAFPLWQSAATTALMYKTTSQRRSAASRVSTWTRSLDLLRDRIWLGTGPGNFGLAYLGRYGGHYDVEEALPSTAQNTVVELLVERGVVGLVPYGIVVMAVIYRVVYCMRSRYARRRRIVAFSIGLGFAAIGLRDLTSSALLHNGAAMVLVTIMIAVLTSLDELGPEMA